MMTEDIYTDEDIQTVEAATAEFGKCAKCEADMPLANATVNPDGQGYLCPFCDGTF